MEKAHAKKPSPNYRGKNTKIDPVAINSENALLFSLELLKLIFNTADQN